MKKLFFGLAFLFVIFAGMGEVHADDVLGNPLTPPNFVTSPSSSDGSDNSNNPLTDFSPSSPSSPSGQVTATNRKNVDLYTSYMTPNGSILGSSGSESLINQLLVRGPFGIAKGVYGLTTKVKSALDNNTIVTNYAGKEFSVSQSVYTGFLNNSGLIYVIAFGVLISLLIALVRGKFAGALVTLGLVFFTNACFFYGGSDIVTKVNSAMNDVSNQVVTTLSGSGSSTDLMSQMVVLPFDYINFDNVKVNSDGTTNVKQSDIDQLLDSKDDDDTIKNLSKSIQSGDSHLTWASIGNKIGVAFSTLVNNLFFGIIFMATSVISFALKLMVILLIALGWIAAILSFFPQFNGVMLNLIKKIFALLISAFALTASTSIILMFNDMISSILTASGITDYGYQTWIKLFLFVVVYIFRKTIFGVFGKAQLASNRVFGKISGAARSIGGNVKGKLAATSLTGIGAGMVAAGIGASYAKQKVSNKIPEGIKNIPNPKNAMIHGLREKRYQSLVRAAGNSKHTPEENQHLLEKARKLSNKRDNRIAHLENRKLGQKSNFSKRLESFKEKHDLLTSKKSQEEREKFKLKMQRRAGKQLQIYEKNRGKVPSLLEMAAKNHARVLEAKQRSPRKSISLSAGAFLEKQKRPSLDLVSARNKTKSLKDSFAQLQQKPFELSKDKAKMASKYNVENPFVIPKK